MVVHPAYTMSSSVCMHSLPLLTHDVHTCMGGTASNSVQSSLKDTVSSVPNYYDKVNIAIKSYEFFGFPVQIKAIFTL